MSAEWLSEQLLAAGVRAGAVIAEDFGWCVPVQSKPHHLYVACASAEGAPDSWKAFSFAEGGVMSRLSGRDTSAASLASVFETVRSVLQANPQIRNLREEAD